MYHIINTTIVVKNIVKIIYHSLFLIVGKYSLYSCCVIHLYHDLTGTMYSVHHDGIIFVGIILFTMR